jgi:DNA-directed RNA polymerase I subunit RPA43
MQKTKNHYIKYTRAELENYTKLDESCVKKINCVEPVRFSPTIYNNFQGAVQRILSRKIGRYDAKLNGVVLDFRNTKIMSTQSAIRQDSPFSLISVETNFYVFSPRKGAIVAGAVKHINRLSMETVISVVIYRVFNVKVTVRGKVKHDLEKDQEIQIRVKDFHFENVIPYIEGKFAYQKYNVQLLNAFFINRRGCRLWNHLQGNEKALR